MAPQMRTGELFVATKRQFKYVDMILNGGTGVEMNPFAIFYPFCVLGGSVVGITYAPLADFVCILDDLNMAKKGKLVSVVDEKGVPTPGVSVRLELFHVPDVVCGTTDSRGFLETRRNLDAAGIRSYHLSGDGYYTSEWVENRYYTLHGALEPKLVRGMPLQLVAKRISRPVEMSYGRLALPQRRMACEVFEYDCELADWLPPLGKGRRADLLVQRSVVGTEGHRASTNTVSITALENGSGFCQRRYDFESALGSDACVPEGVDFSQREIIWRRVTDDAGYFVRDELEDHDMDTYFIMRLRSEADERGKIVRARYGKMTFVQGLGSLAQTYLNVVPNEKSLEAKTRIRPLVEIDGVKRFGGETVWRP